MAQDFTPPPPIETIPPIEAVPAPKKNKTTMWIIIAVVAVLLCCCCLAVAGYFAYQNGDEWFSDLGIVVPILRSLV